MIRGKSYVGCLILVVIYALLGCVIGLQTNKAKVDKTLRFNSEHELTILQLTDLHYGDSDRDNQLNQSITRKLLDLVKPDVVVITGDAISGYAWDKKTKGFYKSNWELFTSPFVEKQTLYAYVLGNHDHQADYNYQQIADLERTNPYSLFKGDSSIDPNSISNYYLEVLSSFKDKKDTPSALLWSFDSKDTGCQHIKESWGCITENQLKWYSETSEALRKSHGQNINGFAFFHIPTPEFLYTWLVGETYGYKLESAGCPKYNTGVISRFSTVGNIKGAFVGHDHNNDFGGFYGNIELVMGRKTGYGSYGPITKNGGRVIKLKEFINDKNELDFTYSHYIITGDGDIYHPEEPIWQGYKDPRFLCAF